MSAPAQTPSPLQRSHRWGIWVAYAGVLLLAPLLLNDRLAVTLLTQMGIAIVACLSYNILLGQGGMLSFGHALYTGLGSYAAIHALKALSGSGLSALAMSAVPLVGGLAALSIAALSGHFVTKKSGTPLAMITLGMAELVLALSPMLVPFFGGEAGVWADRVVAPAWWGISYGPALQLYYLIALYTLVSTGLMYALTRTPLGLLLKAVRDNPQRVEFLGYNPAKVRYLAFMIASFFAGTAGGLAALHFEIVTTEVLGSARSGAYLLFTLIGGTAFFYGPIIGGVLMVLASVWLSGLTQASMLYLGLIFLLMVVYAPGGIAGLLAAQWRCAAHGRLQELAWGYLAIVGTALTALVGAGALIEMTYHRQLHAALGHSISYLGLPLNTTSTHSWFGACFIFLTGLILFIFTQKLFLQQWQHIQKDIEKSIAHPTPHDSH